MNSPMKRDTYVKSKRVPSTEASVPVELGSATLKEHGFVH